MMFIFAGRKKYLLSFLLAIFLVLPNFVLARIPNDPFVEQWSYEHVGLYQAWNYTVGSKDVVVAVIDNGFDTFHPDLRDNVWKNIDEIPDNKIDDDKNGYVDDVWGWNFVAEDVNDDGVIDTKEQLGNNNPRPNVTVLTTDEKQEMIFSHGTMVAGLIGAIGNNETDGAGVNWNVRLMNLKLIDNGGIGTLDELPRAIRYAVDNGAAIINISLVSGASDKETNEAVEYAYKKKVMVVAAAGNNSADLNFSPMYPICSDLNSAVEMVMGVSAITQEHHLTLFSNVGSKCINITAPGQNVSSTVRYSPSNGLTTRYKGGWSGTSFSAPLVSGASALIKSIQPKWGPDQIFSALLKTVHHTPGQDETVYANLFGSGLLQVDKAVKYALEKLGPVHLVSEFLVLNLDDGKMDGWNWADNLRLKNNKILTKVDDWAVYKDGEGTRFFTVKQINSQASQVAIYNSDWKKLKSWFVAGEGKLNIAVGDVAGVEGAEVILSPQFSSDWVWQVYNQSGVRQKSYSFVGKHYGVSLNLISGVVEAKDRIAVLYENGKGLNLVSFGDDLEKNSDFKINALSSRGELAIGDVDGDGKIEYTISGSGSDGLEVAIYDDDGKYKRKFKVSDYSGAIDIQLGDYDKDGKDEIFSSVSSATGNQIKVWSYKGKKFLERPMFVGQTGSKGLKLLVY